VYKGRPASIDAAQVRAMKAQGLGASEIAKALKIGRASVYRVLEAKLTAAPPEARPRASYAPDSGSAIEATSYSGFSLGNMSIAVGGRVKIISHLMDYKAISVKTRCVAEMLHPPNFCSKMSVIDVRFPKTVLEYNPLSGRGMGFSV
jgi:hypothetical protein